MKKLPHNLLVLLNNTFSQTFDLPNRTSRYPWETNNFNDGARFLFSLVRYLQPKLIIELGTFEAHGTMIMYQATRKNNTSIITIDCDVTLATPHFDYQLVDASRTKRIHDANQKGGNIKFIAGESRSVLKKILPKLKQVDFVFQDSMHFIPGLLEEFDLVRNYLPKFGVIVFDDWWMVKLKHLYLLTYLKGRFSSNKTHNPLKGPLDMSFNWYEVNRGKGFLVGQRVS